MFAVLTLIECTAIITGVLYAERIRKRYGCNNYLGRLLGTPELYKKDNKD
jgi:hypothetical protein